MNQNNKKSKVWLILFFIFLIIMICAAGIVLKRSISYRTANNHLESLRSDANSNSGELMEERAQEENPDKTGNNPGINDAEENAATNGSGKAAENKSRDSIVMSEENSAAPITDKSGESKEADPSDPAEEIKAVGAMNLPEKSGIKIPEKALDWAALHEENEDIYAWIYVPDTTVDYPVVQHPTDNSYYLNHNMDGSKGYPGCIYTENFNGRDFADIHTVIYGHNLKDKTMFSSLHNFENKELFDKDHYIYIYTEDYVFIYRIFAAYEFDSLHLLDNYDYTNEYVYEDYLRKIYQTTDRVANVRTDIQVTTKNQIVTLSTCTEDHDSNRRFLVAGVLVNPREQGR